MPTRPLPASRRCAVRQDARAHITRFTECKAACRAPIRTCTELYGSARSAWVKVSPQSELMGPSSAGFRARLRLTSCHIGPSRQPLRTPGGISALALTREETCEVTSSYHTPGFCPSRGQIGHATLLHSLRQFSRYSSLSAPLAGSSRLSHPTPNLAGTIMIRHNDLQGCSPLVRRGFGVQCGAQRGGDAGKTHMSEHLVRGGRCAWFWAGYWLLQSPLAPTKRSSCSAHSLEA